MKKFTLRKMFFIYSLVFLATLAMLCLVLLSVFRLGAKHQVYYYANSDERQAEILKERIEAEQKFSSEWVPKNITYTVIDKENRILSSNGSALDKKFALEFLKGREPTSSEGYFIKVSYPEGTCVLKYHIGTRYSSEWANKYLPSIDIIVIIFLLLIVLISTSVFAHTLIGRLQKDILPLKHTISSIGEGNLNFPIPELSIEEFQELGALTERMRLDLKNTLEALWTNEHQKKDGTAQMLHDCRSPLTVARANAEFLKEDILSSNNKEQGDLLNYAESIIFQLQRLTEVTDLFQRQMISSEDGGSAKQQFTFDSFNANINEIGIAFSEYYGDIWDGKFQKSHEFVPINDKELKQIITNILLNAFEHGKSPQTVRLRFTTTESEVEYCITNSGSFFSKEALLHAKEKGFSEKEKTGESMKGLGLYFVHRRLQECGGELITCNISDNIACVRIRIPLKQYC